MQYALDKSRNDEDSVRLRAVDNGDGSDVGSLASASLTSRSSRLFRKRADPELEAPLNDPEAQENDPFYVFREDLFRKLDLVDEGLAEYLRIVQQTVRSPYLHVVVSLQQPQLSLIFSFPCRILLLTLMHSKMPRSNSRGTFETPSLP
jgi:hypothetical protein